MSYNFVIIAAFLGGVTALYTKGPTGTPLPLPEECITGLPHRFRDNCKRFGSYYDRVVFDNIYVNVYVECMNGAFPSMICRNCAESYHDRPTIYSKTCDMCVFADEFSKPCPTTAPWTPGPTLVPNCDALPTGYCAGKAAGPYPLDETNLYDSFVMCSNGVKTCMPCPSTLVYDKTCKACNYRAAAEKAYRDGGHI